MLSLFAGSKGFRARSFPVTPHRRLHAAQKRHSGEGPSIDHLKRINDTHDHAGGDAVLRGFGRHARLALRATDPTARWGGEGFMLLMPEARLPAARRGVDRLRERVAAHPALQAAGGPVHITASAGLTGHRSGETVAQSTERADRALYEAKAQGRNRTVLA